jgi:hypothetical protein
MNRAAATAGAVLLAAAALQADVYHLLDGDRITGRTLSATASGFRVQTPYGRLTIPRGRVAKVVRDDGTEEVVNPQPSAEPGPPRQPLRLVLVVTGDAFWYVWDPPRGVVVDSTLRLEVSLDEDPVAAYLDGQPDPDDIPEAPLVNAFAFAPDQVALLSLGSSRALAPESRPGRTILRIELPEDLAGLRRLRLAYQVNAGSQSEPQWRDVTAGSTDVTLRGDAFNLVRVRQDRGRMEYSGLLRRRLKNVGTFLVELRPESPTPDGSPEASGPGLTPSGVAPSLAR